MYKGYGIFNISDASKIFKLTFQVYFIQGASNRPESVLYMKNCLIFLVTNVKYVWSCYRYKL